MSVPAIFARPPTSAVDGRKTTPARRKLGSLLILASDTRELRPTVLTASSSFEAVLRICDCALRVAVFLAAVLAELSLSLLPRVPIVRDGVPVPTSTDGDAFSSGDTRDTVLRTADVLRPTVVLFVADISDELSFVFCDVGNTRDAVAPNTDGAHRTNAKKHVANFLISLRRIIAHL